MSAVSTSSEIGALSPPPGVIPNFKNPYSIGEGLKAAGIFFVVLTSLSTAVRLYTKFCIIKAHGWEDYTMMIAWGGFIGYISICFVLVIKYGGGIHQWDVPITEIVPFMQMSLLLEIIYHPLIATTRLSICIQFIRIFVIGHDTRFRCIQGFIWINMMYYLSCFFVSIFSCQPIAKTWNPTLPGHCLRYKGYPTGIFNMLSDLAMLLFPLICTWKMHLSTKQKLQVSAVFFVGSLALVASIIRLVYGTIYKGSYDATFDLTRIRVCKAGELAAGILVGNLVVSPRFFTTFGLKITSLFSSYAAGNELLHPSIPETIGSLPPRAHDNAKMSILWLDRYGGGGIADNT